MNIFLLFPYILIFFSSVYSEIPCIPRFFLGLNFM